MVKTILFLCGHNAGRSQMAQAFFNELNKNPEFIAESAGTNIADEVNKQVIEAMKEVGIDMSNKEEYYPKVIDKSKEYFRIYSMGCNVKCDEQIDDDLMIDDPEGKEIEAVRKIRDDIKEKVSRIIGEIDG